MKEIASVASILIIQASVTGTAVKYAEKLVKIFSSNFLVHRFDLKYWASTFDWETFLELIKNSLFTIIVTSTYGSGEIDHHNQIISSLVKYINFLTY